MSLVPLARNTQGPSNKGEPNTVRKVTPVEMSLVEYTDETGTIRTALVVEIPGAKTRAIWTSPSSESLLATYRPFTEVMGKRIQAMAAEARSRLQGMNSPQPVTEEELRNGVKVEDL